MSKLRIHQYKCLTYLTGKNRSQQRSYCRIYAVPKSTPKEDLWNKALASAFELLQVNKHPQAFLDLTKRDLNLDKLLRNVAASKHPVIHETKRLFVDNRINFQVRGIVALLCAKAAGHSQSSPDYEEAVNQGGISERQRKLVDVMELYHGYLRVHNSILNLTQEKVQVVNSSLLFVNGSVVLLGDYLAAKGSVVLASIRDSEVLRLVSQGTSDFPESLFHGEVDKNGNMLPDKSSTKSVWEKKTFLEHASLLSHVCEGMMVLAGQQELKENARNFGKSIALALKVNQDLYEFRKLDQFSPGTPFSLDLTPVVLHLESDPALVEAILDVAKNDITNLDFQQIHAATQKGNGFEKGVDLLNSYLSEAEQSLENLKPSESTDILLEILKSIEQ